MKASDPPVVVEQTYNASKEKVWNAITDRDEMIQWYFPMIPEFKAKVGFETVFTVENEGCVFPHRWKVLEAEPCIKISYTWKYDNYEGDGYVTFEIFDDDEKTRLQLTCTITEDFDDSIPEFKRESCVGGWEYFIKQSLKEYLEK
ncbi:MAG: SRPBCC domain-containing protein [Calditrichaeota bacterium]|nr:MAG: SRPBCC domain-containing protein [Calditrichota bacterium]